MQLFLVLRSFINTCRVDRSHKRQTTSLSSYSYSYSYHGSCSNPTLGIDAGRIRLHHQVQTGKEHCNADALSRLPLPVTPRMTPVPAETVWTMELLNSTPVDVKEIQAGTRSDSTLPLVMKFLQYGWPSRNTDEAFKRYLSRKEEISIQDGCLLWGNRVMVHSKARERVMEELHDTPWYMPNEIIGWKLRMVA